MANNYETMKLQMRDEFLKYDQAAMIEKFGLRSDDENIYITFFGAIEAFYRHKHIAVDLVTDHLHGLSRKVCDLIAICFSLGAMALLLVGGVSYVMQTADTYSVATNINMTFINAVLPICAAAAIIFYLRDIWVLLRTPSEQVNPKISKEEKIARLLKENM